MNWRRGSTTSPMSFVNISSASIANFARTTGELFHTDEKPGGDRYQTRVLN